MGMPLVEKLQRGYRTDLGEARRALPVHGWTATNASKAIVVENLSLGIEQGQVTLLQDTIQTGELLAFESDRTPTGMLKYQAPDGQHDDTVIALALAWYAGSQQSATSRQKYAFSNGHAARS
jgi:hypothetical protein